MECSQCKRVLELGVDVIVVDSVAALTPRAEINGEMGDSHMGLQARLMSQALRKLTSILYSTQTMIIFINQLRMKIGVMFGNPETTTGGNALKFYASMRIDIRKITAIKNGDDITGNRTRLKVVKNKVAPPFKTVEFDINFGEGICKYSSLIDQATTDEIFKKSGAWYSYGKERIGQGRENVKKYLKENLDVYNDVVKKILETHNLLPLSEKPETKTTTKS